MSWLSHPALAGWWPDGGTAWLNRKQLTLTNNSGGNLNANAVVTITIDTQSLYTLGKLKSDCSDLHIVYNPNSTTYKDLNRYVGFPAGTTCSTSGSSKVSFALQAAVSNAASSTDYYLYYNNSKAAVPTNDRTAFSVGASTATFVCPFDGSSTCLAAGTATPTTETGAIRYSGSKSALSFDGANDIATLTDNGQIKAAFNNNTPFTIEFWVNVTKMSSFQDFFGQAVTNHNFFIGTTNSNTIWVYADQCSNIDIRAGTIVSGQWTHITYTQQTGSAKLYQDGVLVGSDTTFSSCSTESPTYKLGHAGNGYAGAVIDELRVSNSLRYTSNFTPPTSPFVRDSNTALLLHFDENGDDPRNTGKAIDDSGNGNHGTITGAKYVAGLVGVDASTSNTGNVPRQSYAAHEGVFVEEATTNKITNPSFENAVYNTNWTNGTGLVAISNSTASLTKFGATSASITSAHQSYNFSNYNSFHFLYNSTSNKRLAQGFQVTENITTKYISIWNAGGYSTVNYMQMEIQTDNAGIPSDTPITNGVSACRNQTTTGEVPFTFATPPNLTTGTQYHWVIRPYTDSGCTTEATSPLSNNATVEFDSTSPTYAYGNVSTMNTSGTWTADTGKDFIFAVYSNDTSFTTSIDAGNTNTHTLSAYVFQNGFLNFGKTVDATVAKLIFNGTAQTTTYTDMGGGWWRLTYSAAAGAGSQSHGIQILSGKSLYVDGVQLEEKAYATTYTDGTLGTGYAWTGTANNSTSTRTAADLRYSNTSNINNTAGTLSFWFKKQSGTIETDNYYLFSESNGVNWFHFVTTWSGSLRYYFKEKSAYATGINAAQWHHVVVTWNDNTSTVTGFFDNVSQTFSGTYSATTFGTMFIGLWKDVWGQANLSLSDFRIYNAAISSTDVSDLYYAGLVGHSEGLVLDRFGGGDTKGQDPLAVWHMDEGYGTTVNDSSRNNKPLTASGTTWESGIGNTRSARARFLKFDGSTSYLSRAQDSIFDFGTGSFSVSGWFHHTSTAPASGTHTILARYGSAGFKVYMNTSGYICFGIDADSTWSPADTACSGASDGSLADSKWHHVEAVKNGTTSISLYIDGHLAQTTTVTATGTMNTSSTMYLGVDSTGNTNYWNGWLDEFMIYPYARSAAQVKTDLLDPVSVLLGSSIQDPLSNGLVGYWKMDESSGNPTDSSGNSYTLTNNAVATFATGKFANAGSLASASSQYFNTATNMGNIQTTSFWVNPTSTTTYLVDLNGTQTITATSGTIAANSITGSIIYVNGAISSTLAASSWQHVVVTSTTAYAASAFAVGKVGSNYLNGTIDDVRIYNRALTPKEVRDLYNWAPGPAAYLNMDEGSGTTANDISGNSRTGTLNNGPLWAPGKYGKGIKLDGSNDNVSVGDFGY